MKEVVGCDVTHSNHRTVVNAVHYKFVANDAFKSLVVEIAAIQKVVALQSLDFAVVALVFKLCHKAVAHSEQGVVLG